LSKLPSGEAKEKYLKELIDFKSHDLVTQKSSHAVNKGLRKLSTSVRGFESCLGFLRKEKNLMMGIFAIVKVEKN
jgi:hypothetical protein